MVYLYIFYYYFYMYIILSKSIRKEFILKVHRIKGFTVFTKFFNNFHICDNNIIFNNNIFVVDDLTKPIPTEENLTVLYDGLKTYTIEYAISYFKYLIKNYDKLIGSNILDKSRYYHDCSMNFSKTKSCNCKINSPLAFKSFECANADDISYVKYSKFNAREEPAMASSPKELMPLWINTLEIEKMAP